MFTKAKVGGTYHQHISHKVTIESSTRLFAITHYVCKISRKRYIVETSYQQRNQQATATLCRTSWLFALNFASSVIKVFYSYYKMKDHNNTVNRKAILEA